MNQRVLPEGFDDLRNLINAWALPTTEARTRNRHRRSMEEIKAFYQQVMPKAKAALAHLNSVSYDDNMNDSDRNLMNMFLSLSEIATAVEWYDSPSVIDGYDPMQVKMPAELP